MSYCKYHPLQAASHSCSQCAMSLCTDCIDEGRAGDNPRCLLCGGELKSLGVVVDVTPFWRRIDAAFRYPLSAQVLAVIGVISLITAASSFLPLPLMVGIGLLCTGVMTKYYFNCLSATALGNMTAPDITTAYEGGVILVIRLLLAMVIMSVVVTFLYVNVGPGIGGLVVFLMIIGLPAMIITYAMTESVFQALNPFKLGILIVSIGLPYGLILGILMIMMASVGVLSGLIGFQQSIVTLTLQSAVSNYYSVVMFHLMGYMIFQYQHQLGYIAEASKGELPTIRPESEKALARLQLMIKEGYWDTSRDEFRKALKLFPNDDPLNKTFFQFTLAALPEGVRDGSKYDSAMLVCDDYFAYLIRSGQSDRLYLHYKMAILSAPGYQPQRPELSFEIAQACHQHGNSKMAVKLLNGLHKRFPRYLHLVSAYQLLASALDEIPNMADKARQCRKLVVALKERAAPLVVSLGVENKPSFAVESAAVPEFSE